MYRLRLLGLLAALALLGCSGSANDPRRADPGPDEQPAAPPVRPVVEGPKDREPPSVDPAAARRRELYDAALLRAATLQGDRQYTEALQALREAAAIQPGKAVQEEIERLEARLALQQRAERAIQDIRLILKDGKPEAAAALAADALRQYGGTDLAAELEQLKRQADALVAAPLDDAAAKRARFQADLDAAFKDPKEPDLRGAALALEQLVLLAPDAARQKQLDEIHDRLRRYDEGRRRADELRRDPANAEDALAALQEAAKAWDTFQVRQDIDAVTLLLQTRRERLSVADFEVRGDAGAADVGKSLADQLLPEFKARFDLVERSQITRVLDELKADGGPGDDPKARAEVGRLAKVRYLVVGSVNRLGGVTLNARLIDVKTGLVVQTANAVAPTIEELVPLLPHVAKVLQMTDEEKLADEARLAREAAAVKPVEDAPLPAPPSVPGADEAAPAPVVTATVAPPAVGDLNPDAFDALPDKPVTPVVVLEREASVKRRLLQISVALGDNLFRRGRYREAHARYQLALDLADDRSDIQVRLDRCVPFLPPPIDVAPPPRLAVLNFVIRGDPRVVPRGLSSWTPENLTPYFCPPYEVVDRGELFWYMGRMGLSMRDVLLDPAARRWLGRALGVRFFLFGTVREKAGFDVTTHLVDAEYGCEVGHGRVHVRNVFELRCRLAELARLTMLDPLERRRQEEVYAAAIAEQARFAALAEEERLRRLRETDNAPLLLIEGERFGRLGRFSIALELFGRARKLRPDSVEVNVYYERADERARAGAREAARRAEWQRQQEQIAQARQRQLALARAAEEARARAEQQAAAWADAERAAWQRRREDAARQLLAQGEVALKRKNFTVSIQVYQSAAALGGNDQAYARLAEAQAQANAAARDRARQEEEAREAVARRRQEQELARARARLEEERRRHEAAEKALREAQAARDRENAARLVKEGQGLLDKGQYDAAVSALQTARRLQPGAEADTLLDRASVEQARAAARQKGEKDLRELENRLTGEKKRRETAEAEAVRNRNRYEEALKKAGEAMAARDYAAAAARYDEAAKVFNTPVALAGLRKAQQAQKDEIARTQADAERKAVEARKAEELKRLKAEGVARLNEKKYADAVQLLSQASQIAPTDADVLANLNKAQHALADAQAVARRDAEKGREDAEFRRLLESGKASLNNKQYDAALAALGQALALRPGDKDALRYQQEAKQKADAAARDEKAQAELARKLAEYQKAIGTGRTALKGGNYDLAITSFKEAQKILPNDATAGQLIKEAEKARADTLARQDDERKKREQELQKAQAIAKAIARGRAALALDKIDEAEKAFNEAAQVNAKDPNVVQALADLSNARKAARVRQLVADARKAIDAKRFADAEKLLADARALAPKDAAVQSAAQDLARAKQPSPAEVARQKKLKEDYDLAMSAGRDAMKKQNYAGAANAFKEALRLVPGDKDATDLLRAAERARDQAAGAEAKKQEDFKKLMASAQAAMTGRRFKDAVTAYTEALKLVPSDAAAQKGLADAKKAQADDAAQADRKKREAAYGAAMRAGGAAMGRKQYAEAVQAFDEALRQMPGDAAAAKARKEAQAALDAAKTPPPNPRADYDKQMQAGAALDRAKKYGEAMDAYKLALKALPGDAKATAALKLAEFNLHVAEAQKAAAARRFPDAVKEYEAALKLFPDNKDVKDALKRARDGKP